MSAPTDDPHGGAEVATAGADLDDATAAAIALHGRGASARSILQLAEQAAQRADAAELALLAPRARRHTWYPNSFMDDIESNQPHLDSALAAVDRVVDRAADAVGRERVVLVGFSQGGCLASEFVGRNPARYGGLAALSGGRIGPEGVTWNDDGDLEGTPAFLGCSDRDPHIPEERVHETAENLRALGADVTVEIYPGMAHTVNRDELEHVAALIADALEA